MPHIWESQAEKARAGPSHSRPLPSSCPPLPPPSPLPLPLPLPDPFRPPSPSLPTPLPLSLPVVPLRKPLSGVLPVLSSFSSPRAPSGASGMEKGGFLGRTPKRGVSKEAPAERVRTKGATKEERMGASGRGKGKGKGREKGGRRGEGRGRRTGRGGERRVSFPNKPFTWLILPVVICLC